MIYGQHPHDHERDCPSCITHGQHVYLAGQILTTDTVTVGGNGCELFCEAMILTCLPCGGTYSVAGALRPDVGNEEYGWIFDRRPTEADRDTVRPGEAAA